MVATTGTHLPSPAGGGWRVLVTRQLPPPAMAALADSPAIGELLTHSGAAPMKAGDLAAAAASGVDAMLVTLADRVTPELLAAAAPRLALVSTLSVGVDHIALDAAAASGVAVGHTPHVLTASTADLAVGLSLAALRRFRAGTEASIRGTCPPAWSPDWLLGADLTGATVGIVGLGRIGQAVAKRLAGFDTTLLYAAPREVAAAAGLGVARVGLPELLARSDVVLPLCPASAATAGMFDEAAFRAMKAGSVFVNVARGELVDTAALVRVLVDDWVPGVGLAGAALDVTDPEPLPVGHPLLGCERVFVTPHVGSATAKTRTAMAMMAVGNILAAADGQPLLARVGRGGK